MAKMSDVPFAIQKGDTGPKQNSRETLVNMFAEISVAGRARIVRKQRACLRSVYAIAGEKRCIEKLGAYHYCVIGDTVYQFDGTNLLTLGTIGSTTGRCTMISNDNDEIMISDGLAAYVWDGATLAAVTIPANVVPGPLTYLGGYGVFNNVGTDVFYSTSANDFANVDELDFATAESLPDPLIRVFADHNELWLAGKQTIEIWQLTGGSDFPFQAITSAKVERGCAAAFSFAADDNTVIFLGDDLVVYRADGYRPQRVSTHAVEEAIRKCSPDNIADARAFLYTLGGHKFYTLTIPDQFTAQYNFATGLWNEASSYGSSFWDVVGSNGHLTDFVLTPIGIAELSPDVNEDEGAVVLRKAISSPGWADGRRITMTELLVDCEVGRAPIGKTASVLLRVARDGETFGNQRSNSVGLTGEYKTRSVFRGLGQGRKPVLELSATGDFNFAIMGTLLNHTVDNS